MKRRAMGMMLVRYRCIGLETHFVMDPTLIQAILFDDVESYSRQPLNDDVFGAAIGRGLLNAEGHDWRWQRRLAAPLFRAEDVLAYVPTFAAACEPVLRRWSQPPWRKPGDRQGHDPCHLAGAARYRARG
jgi:cytochrome P450